MRVPYYKKKDMIDIKENIPLRDLGEFDPITKIPRDRTFVLQMGIPEILDYIALPYYFKR